MTSAIVTNKHDADLALPMGGPNLRPGVPVKVERWSAISEHSLVRAWLAAGVLSVEDGVVVPPEVASPPTDEMAALRARYQNAFGKRAYHGWDADTLREKIELAEGV